MHFDTNFRALGHYIWKKRVGMALQYLYAFL